MLRFIIRRFLLMLVVMAAVVVLLFVLSRVQGDPRVMYLTANTTPEQWDAWGRKMGLDRPVAVQFLVWFGQIVRGDLGDSLKETRPVTQAVAERIPASLQLGVASWAFAMLVGWPLGVLSAVRRGTIPDYAGRIFALFGQALPPFWVGIMLILIFAVQLEWLPVGRRGGLSHFVLPVITLGWLGAAAQLRLVRSSMLEVLNEEYIKVARAKGLTERVVIWRHALRNAAIPPITFAGIALSSFITGAVVVEQVFAWPGLGRMAVSAVTGNDFPLLVGAVLVITFLYLVLNLLLDLVYVYIDPRIRFQ